MERNSEPDSGQAQSDLYTLHGAHQQHVESVLDAALAAADCDAVIIDAGQPHTYFLDDQDAPLRLNPLFKWFTPLVAAPGSAILKRRGERARLLWFQPRDYWHLPPADPDPGWTGRFEVDLVHDQQARERLLSDWLATAGRCAWLGENAAAESNRGCRPNPPEILHHVHFVRATKTPYELACMRMATRRGVLGHRAARDSFEAGGSELDVHLAYLGASRQTDADTPYANIVAFDRHAAVLHYQHRDARRAAQHTFLIDAGATSNGYASDITRTWARDRSSTFAALLQRMDDMQQQIVAAVAPGLPYPDLDVYAHQLLAGVLLEAGLCRGPADALIDTGITRAFLPHGLGHMLGLQTHDCGGLIADASGTPAPPPERDPALRNTRTIEPGQVFTIEPGLYFIPMLLDALRGSGHATLVNWPAVEALMCCGGIRIEDNVIVTDTGVENMTRGAFTEAEA